MPEPRYLDITPENYRRTNTGAGKGDGRGTERMNPNPKYDEGYEKVQWKDPSYDEWLKEAAKEKKQK